MFVGEYYIDPNDGEVTERSAFLKANGTIDDEDYDLRIAQAQLGIADFSEEIIDNEEFGEKLKEINSRTISQVVADILFDKKESAKEGFLEVVNDQNLFQVMGLVLSEVKVDS